MTNQSIILLESVKLMEQGIISGCGIFGTYTDRDGNEKKIELPESIHTFAAWKARGYVVKRGEHAIAAFCIWKHIGSNRRDSDDQEEEHGDSDGRMIMKKAFFFKRSQVEPMNQATA